MTISSANTDSLTRVPCERSFAAESEKNDDDDGEKRIGKYEKSMWK